MAPAVALVAAFALASCGEEDFKNDPRPPAPIELTARIADDVVNISPHTAGQVGAGLATITISIQSQDPAVLVLEGPSDESQPPQCASAGPEVAACSGEVVAGGTGDMKVNLQEGDYTISAQDSSALAAKLEVGPERATSQNDLLLP